MITPYDPDHVAELTEGDPVAAVVRAWTEPGPHPRWHRECVRLVRSAMPVLAASLDQLAAQRKP